MKRNEETLAECLDEIMAGRATVDECIKRYPGIKDELASLVRLAKQIPPLPDVHPSQEFRMRARRTLHQETARRGASSRTGHRFAGVFHVPTFRLRLAAPLVAVFLVALFVFGGGGGVAFASQRSLPGDLLYPVKTATERGRLIVTFSSEGKAEYRLELAQKRVDEVLGLAESGRAVDAATVDAIAEHVDKALADLRHADPENARVILTGFSASMEKQREALEKAKTKASQGAWKQLDNAELYVDRGRLIAGSVSEDTSRLEQPGSVKALREGEIKGPISSLNPLTVAGIQVDVSGDTRIDGTLAVGETAEVKGIFRDNDVLSASRIKVEQGGEVEVEKVWFKGVISDLDPLTIAGRQVVPALDAEMKGVLREGLVAAVTGQTQEDGLVLASKIEIERFHKETEVRGAVVSIDPLTIGSTVVVLSIDAEVEGDLQVGAISEAKGQFLPNGEFLASRVKVREGKKGEDRPKQEDRSTPDNGQSGTDGQGNGQDRKDQPNQDRQDREQGKALPSGDQGAGKDRNKDQQGEAGVKPGNERSIEGVIVEVTSDEVTVEVKKNEHVKMKLTPETDIKVNGSTGKPGDLPVGARVKATYDSDSGAVAEIQGTAATPPRPTKP